MFLSVEKSHETNQWVYQEVFEIKHDDQISAEEEANNRDVQKNKGAKASSSKKMPYNREKPNNYMFHLFHAERRKLQLFWSKG